MDLDSQELIERITRLESGHIANEREIVALKAENTGLKSDISSLKTLVKSYEDKMRGAGWFAGICFAATTALFAVVPYIKDWLTTWVLKK